MTRLSLALAFLGSLAACNAQVEPCTTVRVCPDGGACSSHYAYSGLATIHPHTTDADFLESVVSFKFATTVDDGTVGNNWDLSLDREDLLRVNTVTDDESWIVDLGMISLDEVPETIDPNSWALGVYGTHDEIPAVLEHVYLVRTIDTSTRQYAAFRVVAIGQGQSVSLEWFRSSDAEKFAFSRGAP